MKYASFRHTPSQHPLARYTPTQWSRICFHYYLALPVLPLLLSVLGIGCWMLVNIFCFRYLRHCTRRHGKHTIQMGAIQMRETKTRKLFLKTKMANDALVRSGLCMCVSLFRKFWDSLAQNGENRFQRMPCTKCVIMERFGLQAKHRQDKIISMASFHFI